MVNLTLTDDEVTTILVALDNYAEVRRVEWMESRKFSSDGTGDEELLHEAGSAEWCWQKLFHAQQQFRNSIADAVGEGEINNLTSASVDPFSLPTRSE